MGFEAGITAASRTEISFLSKTNFYHFNMDSGSLALNSERKWANFTA